MKTPMAQGFSQASANPKGGGKQHRPGIRTPPEHGRIMVKPGEDACAVGPAEGGDVEAAAGSEEPVGARLSRWGKGPGSLGKPG